MTALRQRMIQDMRLRNLSPHTIDAYVHAVAQCAKYFHCSPEQLDGEQVRQYLLHLVQDQHASYSRYNQARCALLFLYRNTLGRDQPLPQVPFAKVPRRLPTVLSADEVRRLLAAVRHRPQHQALLMTLYGAGLRISEALNLKPADIDSARMVIHVRGGKGNKDRLVQLSSHLLAVRRDYWRQCRPGVWLTDAELDSVEAALETSLPASFREFMKRFGPVHTPRVLDEITDRGLDHPDIQEFLSAREAIEGTKGYWSAGMPDDVVGVASDCMGNMIGFRRNAERCDDAPVLFFDHDFVEVSEIAPSFDSFLDWYLGHLTGS